MNEHKRIAKQIFSTYGLDFETATRAGGWTNAVWLNGDLVLRLSFHKDSDRIRREVLLSKCLPDVIGYPVNIAVGLTDGYEWSLSKRIYGKNLSEVWSNLDWNDRAEAIRQIIKLIEQLQQVDTDKINDLTNKRAWYSSFNVEETYTCLEKYKHQNIFTSEQIDNLYDILNSFWEKHNSKTHVLNHGDVTMDNLLWLNGKIVSLMDFEHSMTAPSEFDLHSLINLAFFSEESEHPSDGNSLEYEEYKKDVIALLKPLLLHSYSIDLILGYAILFRMRFLEFWLENPEGELEQLDAYIKLLSLANSEGNYLTDLFKNITD